jgi:hypothetical protein
MTLYGRNRIITLFLFGSLGVILSFIVFLVLESIRNDGHFNGLWFPAPYNYYAVLASSIFLTISAPLVTFLMLQHFEKTQAQECLYFAFFLFACLTESARFCIPLFNLWQGSSRFLSGLTRVLVFGRLFAPTAFFFSAVLPEQNRDVERNVMVMVTMAGIIAVLIPVNTTHILPTCMVQTGFTSFFKGYTICLYLLTTLCLAIQTRSAGPEHKLVLLGYVLLFAGYLLLIRTTTWFAFAPGVIAFSAGTYLYLVNLHRTYV